MVKLHIVKYVFYFVLTLTVLSSKEKISYSFLFFKRSEASQGKKAVCKRKESKYSINKNKRRKLDVTF